MADNDREVAELLALYNRDAGPGGRKSVMRWPSSERAASHYARAAERGRVSARRDGNIEEQTEAFHDAMRRQEALDRYVKQVMAGFRVPPMHTVPYCAFARHVARVCREHIGETRRVMVNVAVARWLARGLDENVLKAIVEMVSGE